MNLLKRAAFTKDLHKILMKHGITAIGGSSDNVSEITKDLDGFTLFFTKGEKNPHLTVSKNACQTNVTEIKVLKSRYKHEDDGN